MPLRNKAGLSESSISKTPTAYRWGQILQPHCVRQRLARRKENALLGHRSGDMMPSLISHGKTAHKCCFENSVLVFAKGSLLWSTALCGQISPCAAAGGSPPRLSRNDSAGKSTGLPLFVISTKRELHFVISTKRGCKPSAWRNLGATATDKMARRRASL